MLTTTKVVLGDVEKDPGHHPSGSRGGRAAGSFPCETRDLLSQCLVPSTEVPSPRELASFLKHLCVLLVVGFLSLF